MQEMRADGLRGKIKWNSNWVTFLDGMIASGTNLPEKTNEVLMRIRRIFIDPKTHFELLKALEPSKKPTLELVVSRYAQVSKAGGIEMHDSQNKVLNKRRPRPATLETYKFIPFFSNQSFSLKEALKILLQMISENNPKKKLTVVEIDAENELALIAPVIVESSNCLIQTLVEVTVLTSKTHQNLDRIEFASSDLNQIKNIDLIVNENARTDQSFLNIAERNLSKSGFIISRESNEKASIDSSFIEVSRLKVDGESLSLLKLKKVQLMNPAVINISSNVGEWLGPLKANFDANETIVVAESELSGIVGLVNCIRKEPFLEGLKCVAIKDSQAESFDINDPLYKTQLVRNLVMNVLKDGEWGSYRHLDLMADSELKPRKNHCFVDCTAKGDFSTISWLCGPLDVNNVDDDLIYVTYASLNFKDVMIASGKIVPVELGKDKYTGIGMEFSGVTKKGKRVMGADRFSGVMTTHYKRSENLIWDVPDDWTLEEAATVPLVYSSVYFAFFIETKVQKGNSILIHAGSGGVGQAAIQVALAYGLTVFTTVSSQEKQEYLMQRFPQLEVGNIGNSRNADFEMMIMERTKGEGVDFVLNSLSGELLQASIRCLKYYGTFIEFGQFDIQNQTNIHMGHLSKRINFKAIIFVDSKTKLENLKVI